MSPPLTKGTTMTEIHPGDPVRSVELRESAWNTILEATQYSGIGTITNVVDAIKEQLREPIAVPTDDHPGYTVQGDQMASDGDVIPLAREIIIDNNALFLEDGAGKTIAAYAPGFWGHVTLTEPKEAGDDRATS